MGVGPRVPGSAVCLLCPLALVSPSVLLDSTRNFIIPNKIIQRERVCVCVHCVSIVCVYVCVYVCVCVCVCVCRIRDAPVSIQNFPDEWPLLVRQVVALCLSEFPDQRPKARQILAKLSACGKGGRERESGGGGGARERDEDFVPSMPGEMRVHTQPSASDAASNKASWMPDLSGMRPCSSPIIRLPVSYVVWLE
jgi:hypothetical protein